MTKSHPLRLIDLKVGDHVVTPTGRTAMVTGFNGPRVQCWYADTGDDVDLLPHILTLQRSAPAQPVKGEFIRSLHAEWRMSNAPKFYP